MTTAIDPSKRRSYRSPVELLRDLGAILRRAPQIRDMMRGRSLDPAFRERLMLAVTQVNNCRYCAYAHARMALVEGVSPEEIEAIGRGSDAVAPEAERPAIRYAQDWAASDGNPGPQAVEELRQRYGDDKAAAIELSLRIIRLGNLLGNTWDKLRSKAGSAAVPPAV